jgi:hypothetical protein
LAFTGALAAVASGFAGEPSRRARKKVNIVTRRAPFQLAFAMIARRPAKAVRWPAKRDLRGPRLHDGVWYRNGGGQTGRQHDPDAVSVVRAQEIIFNKYFTADRLSLDALTAKLGFPFGA